MFFPITCRRQGASFLLTNSPELGFWTRQDKRGVLCVAGSETTATLLCGVTFLLLKHPDIMNKLKREVRSIFKSEDEITLTSIGNLESMLACLNEALRAYLPAPVGFPREVLKGGVTINGQFIPEGVSLVSLIKQEIIRRTTGKLTGWPDSRRCVAVGHLSPQQVFCKSIWLPPRAIPQRPQVCP